MGENEPGTDGGLVFVPDPLLSPRFSERQIPFHLDGEGEAVVILDNPSDGARLEVLLPRIPGNPSIIATTPGTCWELEKKGIKYSSIEEHSDARQIYQIGLENYEILDRFCREVDGRLSGKFAFLRNEHLAPALDNFSFIKILFDAFTIRNHILAGICSREKPGLLMAFASGRSMPSFSPFLPFGPGETLFSELLALPGWPCRRVIISCEDRDPLGERPFHRHGVQERRIRSVASSIPVFFDILHQLKRRDIRKALSLVRYGIRNTLARGAWLAVNGYGYDWNLLIPDLYRAGYRIIHLDTGGLPDGPPHETSLPPLDDLIDGICKRDQPDIGPVFRRRFIPLLWDSLDIARASSEACRSLLEKKRPAAILCGTKPRFRDHIPAHIARSGGIPVISWQHGSQGMSFAPITPYTEFLNSDVHLSYGYGVSDMYRTLAETAFSCKLVSTGSYELEDLFLHRRESPGERTVLYATTSYYQNNLYISGPSVFQDIPFWRTQQDILRVIGDLGIKCTFKLHPGSPEDLHIREFVEREGFRHIRILKGEKTFTRLLGSAEMVILDFPSTTLLQAIAAGKTVFVLISHYTLTDEAARLLGKRAYVGRNPDEFTGMIRSFFTGQRMTQHPDRTNTEFLERYGVHRLDGLVARRALDVLEGKPPLSGDP